MLKVIATRSDGKKVFAGVGVASVANSTIQQSEIILQADRLVFVPSSDVNAELKNLLVVGQVDGVTALQIPSALIGDLSVGTLKIANGAVTSVSVANVFSNTSISYNASLLGIGGLLMSVVVDSAGNPTVIQYQFDWGLNLTNSAVYIGLTLQIDGTTYPYTDNVQYSPGDRVGGRVTRTYVLTGLSPGPHTFSLYGIQNRGTNAVFMAIGSNMFGFGGKR